MGKSITNQRNLVEFDTGYNTTVKEMANLIASGLKERPRRVFGAPRRLIDDFVGSMADVKDEPTLTRICDPVGDGDRRKSPTQKQKLEGRAGPPEQQGRKLVLSAIGITRNRDGQLGCVRNVELVCASWTGRFKTQREQLLASTSTISLSTGLSNAMALRRP